MFETHDRLAAPFDVTFTDVRGGVELTYVSGEQVVRRLNEVLGVGGWSFRVLRHDIHPESDEAWALGASRVWLHTCTLDSPNALPNYKARGFDEYRREHFVAQLPDD